MPARDPRLLLWSVVGSLGAGYLGFNALPFVVGALVEGGLAEGHAGLIGSLEIAGMAASALALAPRVSVLSLRTLALLGAAGAAGAHLLSTFATGFASLAALRLAAGVAGGAIVAAGNALIATSVDPDRLAARAEVLAGLAAAAVLVALPWAVQAGAQRGAFALMALVVLACTPLIARIPHARPAPSSRAGLRGLAGPRALSVVACGFLLTAGEGALWAFVERIGIHVGVTPASVGVLLGAATLVGLLGAALAVWLGTRFGRRLPLVAGIAAQAIACWLVSHAEAPTPYVASVLAYGVAFFFVQPYLVGTAAVADPRGRLAAAYGGVVLLGGGIGPALGGALVEWASYPALGWLLLAASVAATLAILPLAAALDRASRPPAERV